MRAVPILFVLLDHNGIYITPKIENLLLKSLQCLYMTSTQDTSPDEADGGGSNQLSTKALQEMLRPHAIKAINKLVEILDLPASEKMASSQIGAARLILSKVVPDLKSVELTGKDGKEVVLPVPIMGGLSAHPEWHSFLEYKKSKESSQANQTI